MTTNFENIRSCFLGLAIGDALGVPVEFRDRSFFKSYPVKEMLGYGTWNQPPGTWSDDSSLTFCLAESLVNGYDLNDIGKRFVAWYRDGYWGAHHKLFDVGRTTRMSIARISNGHDPLFSGELDEDSNGNGSLMRIAPAALYFYNESDEDLYNRIKEISSVTHAHFQSVFSCFIFSKLLIQLLKGVEKVQALVSTGLSVRNFALAHQYNSDQVNLFSRILDKSIVSVKEELIDSSGYVLSTLEASIWCFMTTDTYSDAVLKAVNLGGDTDTTACVTGALAGLYYGIDGLPTEWMNALARKQDIINLADDFTNRLKDNVSPKT